MTWPPRFLFIGNRLSVDFVLTGGEGERAFWERWNTPEDLGDWFDACSLGLSLARVRPRELVAARELREAVWHGVQAVLRKRKLPAGVVGALERCAARPDLVPVWKQGQVRWSADATVSQALSTIARDALALFGTEASERLRECRNPRCPLVFVDTSRPGQRAWCTMRRCGNLKKTARYRQRNRADGPDRKKTR